MRFLREHVFTMLILLRQSVIVSISQSGENAKKTDQFRMQRSLDFVSVNVLCIGDIMLDRFVSGSVNRISPEGPVPVMSVVSEKEFPGGAANVARNIAALGARCTLVGVSGVDEAGKGLRRLLGEVDGITTAFVESNSRPTSTKIRFIGQNQQILRVDIENSSSISQGEEDELLGKILPLIPLHDVIILSDYAKGVLTKRIVSTVIETGKRYKCPVIVDPKVADIALFSGATIITPNQKETQTVLGVWPVSDSDAEHAGEAILERFDIDSVLITRAERGMTYLEKNGSPIHIKAEAREVFDVVGAGDTVIAVLGVALGAGASKEDAARIANTAAGIVVGKKGTATVSASELHDALSRANRTGASVLNATIDNSDELHALVSGWQKDGLKVGFTNGCFDILHVGHTRLLEFARRHCDRLVVGLNSDHSVQRLKGPGRPINPESDRAELLRSLSFVDAVFLFGEDTPLKLIERISPDVLIKGADYTINQIVGADFVQRRGGEVLTFEIVPGKSTTATINRSQAGKD